MDLSFPSVLNTRARRGHRRPWPDTGNRRAEARRERTRPNSPPRTGGRRSGHRRGRTSHEAAVRWDQTLIGEGSLRARRGGGNAGTSWAPVHGTSSVGASRRLRCSSGRVKWRWTTPSSSCRCTGGASFLRWVLVNNRSRRGRCSKPTMAQKRKNSASKALCAEVRPRG